MEMFTSENKFPLEPPAHWRTCNTNGSKILGNIRYTFIFIRWCYIQNRLTTMTTYVLQSLGAATLRSVVSEVSYFDSAAHQVLLQPVGAVEKTV